MMNILNSLANLLTLNKPETPAVIDPTVYCVETAARNYCGVIIYQDDVVIKIKGFKPKPVKILKTNIERITIMKTEAAVQYYQRQKTRTEININKFQFS